MCSFTTGRKASQIFSYTSLEPHVLNTSLEKLACIPDPFQSVAPSGFGCQLMASPYFSPRRSSKYLEIQISSPACFAPLAKHWYSHCPEATSALIPSTLIPASKHWSKCSSIISLPKAFLAPTEQ